MTQYRIQRHHTDKIKYSIYYSLLSASWKKLFLFSVFSFICIHIIFAGLYCFDIKGIKGGEELSSTFRCFVFSIQTFSTIGYGALIPVSIYIHLIVALQSFIALFYIALLTGCFFVKLSRAPITLIFSKNAVIYMKDKVRYLSIRLVNEQHGELTNVNATLYLRRKNLETNLYQLLPLTLERAYTPSLSLNWVLLHEIAEDSPLTLCPLDQWVTYEAQLIASINAHDDIYQQQIHQRHIYTQADCLEGYIFQDMITLNQEQIFLDIHKIHAVQPVKN